MLQALLLVSCSFDTSGISVASRTQICTAEIWHCPQVTGSVSVSVSPAGAHPQVANYTLQPNLWKDKSQTYRPYWDSPIVLKAVPDVVKGATLISTGVNDWKDTTPAFMEVRLNSGAGALYLAYDSRVAPPPWLSSGYTKQAAALTLSKKDPATAQPLTLDLWQLNGNRTPGEVVTIPGPRHGVAAGAPPATSLMYVVLVTPTSTVDCAVSGERIGTFNREDCPDTPGADPLPALIHACTMANPGLTCRAPSCAPGQFCNPTDTGRGIWPVKSYRVGSRVEFIPPSRIDATIRGQAAAADITGALGFSYDGDLTNLIIDDLTLRAGPIATDEGPFEDTTMVLWTAAVARCVGGPPGFAQPCNDYRITAGGLQVSVTSRFKGQDLLWLGESVQPVDVHIDHTTRTFRFTGTLQVEITIDGEPADLDATLDLYGYIADVMPEAVGDLESDLMAECVEDRNHQAVVLNAAGSFDVYAPSPTNLPRYEWYEDYGLATQRSWGSGLQTVIPGGQLAYGSHQITLVVGDQDGRVDTDTFTVQVADDVAPVFESPPQDITTDVYPAGTETVAVDLGALSAHDACHSPVLVSNDGPADGLFTPGVHTVTWTADDQRGNTATVTQTVRVRVLSKHFPWPWVGGGLGALVVAVAGIWFALRKKAASRRPAAEAGWPPPPPGSSAPLRWLAVGAGVALVAAAAVIAVLLLRHGEGAPAANPSTTIIPTTEPVTFAPGTATTSEATTSSAGSTTGAETTTTEAPSTTPGTSTTEAPSTTPGTSTTEAPTTTEETSSTEPVPTLDPAGPPTYGEVKLISGFLQDPATYAITAGGPIDVAAALPGCAGYTALNPDLSFRWVGTGLLRFYWLPDSADVDAVMVIYDPSGQWRCADDSWDTRHPTIDFNPSQDGYYQIWVGTYNPGSFPTGTLYVTEMEANHP